MSQPNNDPSSGLTAAIPFASHAPIHEPAIGDMPPIEHADPRTRNWLIVAGIIWSLLFIFLILTASTAAGATILDIAEGKTPLNSIISLAILSVATYAVSALVLKLALGTFRRHRWVATAAPATAMVLLIYAAMYNPIFVFVDSIHYSNIFSSAARRPASLSLDDDDWVIMSIQGILLLIAGLLVFIHLRPATSRYLASHDRRHHWMDDIPMIRLVLVGTTCLTVLGEVLLLLNPFSFAGPYFNGDMSYELPIVCLLLGLGLLVLHLRGSRWNWPVALALYGLWIYRMGFTFQGKVVAPVSYYPSLILLAFMLAAMHLWFRNTLKPTPWRLPAPAKTPSPIPALPIHVQPILPKPIPSLAAQAQPTSAQEVPLPPTAQHAIHTLSYASLPVNTSRHVQSKIIFSSILWVIMALYYSTTAYMLLQLRYRDIFRYSPTRIDGFTYFTRSISMPRYLPQLAFSLLAMLVTASIAAGLLQKKRWSASLAAAFAPLLLFLLAITPTMDQFRLLTNNSFSLRIYGLLLVIFLLPIAAVAFLIRQHFKPDIARYFHQLNPKPSWLDAHPQGHLQLICWFLALAGMATYFIFDPSANQLNLFQDSEYPIDELRLAVAILSIITAVLIYKKTVLGWILGLGVCSLCIWQALAIAVYPPSIRRGWDQDTITGLGIAIMIFCGLVLLSLLRTLVMLRSRKPAH